MATLQRGGRVGRAKQESAVLLVAGEDTRSYFVRHPKALFTSPPESAVINPDNPIILEQHLECAAAEICSTVMTCGS